MIKLKRNYFFSGEDWLKKIEVVSKDIMTEEGLKFWEDELVKIEESRRNYDHATAIIRGFTKKVHSICDQIEDVRKDFLSVIDPTQEFKENNEILEMLVDCYNKFAQFHNSSGWLAVQRRNDKNYDYDNMEHLVWYNILTREVSLLIAIMSSPHFPKKYGMKLYKITQSTWNEIAMHAEAWSIDNLKNPTDEIINTKKEMMETRKHALEHIQDLKNRIKRHKQGKPFDEGGLLKKKCEDLHIKDKIKELYKDS